MMRIYRTISPVLLLLSGWIVIGCAMWIRIFLGEDVPAINCIFVILGLAAYFLPTRFVEKDSGEALRRKLLWLLIAAGFIILTGELIRGFLLNGQG